MKMQRRHFIRNSFAGGVGLALARPLSLFALTTPATVLNQPGPVLIKGKSDDLKLNQGDIYVLSLVSQFGDRALFTGGCVAGKLAQASFRVSHILAKITDLDRYNAFVGTKGSVTGNGISISNTICFNYQQTTYELEALLPEVFDQRLSDIQAGLNADGSEMVYAHEALLYEPAQKALTDSFKAMAGKMGTLKRIQTPDGFGDLFGGSIDVAAFRLLNSSRDQSALNSLFGTTVKTADDALAVTAAFLQNISYESQVDPVSTITSQCRTRLIRSAVQMILGADSLRIAGNFAGLRAKIPADITDGTVWHALFQGSENPPSGTPRAAALALRGRNTLAKYLTMQEFLKTGLVKSNPVFKNYV